MRILIDIGHPAHIHYFKLLAKYFIKKNDIVLFVTRDKEVTIDLLKHYKFNYINIGKPFKSTTGKLFGLFWFSLRLGFIALKYKPDIYLNSTFYCSFIGRVFGRPVIGIDDTFYKQAYVLSKYLYSAIITGDYPHPNLNKKEISVAAYQELLYLHPNYFTPDKKVLNELGLNENDKYVIIRFVSWQASHDVGHKGMLLENKIRAVKEFQKYAKVFISSESKLPSELETFRIKIVPHHMHDALAFASLVIGESFTMLSEAVILGTPAILVHNTKCYYLTEQKERYGLSFIFTESETDQSKAIGKGIELLNIPNIKEEWQKRRVKMLADKIDYTAFMIWFVENYPKSHRIIKDNPDYQYKFK